ncbi:hypothetical protein OV203_50325 [Nannocystis sp. ILAH1]|uniref:MXAN_5187 C-terminal domain-containing protein n=1 Tax=Nannocystis sp. ILAH1 TaxID=2996789 RepID=UPI0022703E84|nr:MXAN_5187 C-terminal domain-containing protein [Nannocystis sp. ILAH1]MCY0995423.1 hypothetical protein [Nannocystis sp. ILAH1]
MGQPTPATVRAFLRRLERDRVIRPDVRAVLAVERFLRDLSRDTPRAELGAALASILAVERKQWRAIEARFQQFLAEPEAFVAHEIGPLEITVPTPYHLDIPPSRSYQYSLPSVRVLRWQQRWQAWVRRRGLAIAGILWLARLRTITLVIILVFVLTVVGFVLAAVDGTQWLTTEIQRSLPGPARSSAGLPRFTGLALWLCSVFLAVLARHWILLPHRYRAERLQQRHAALQLRAKLAADDEGLTVIYAVDRAPPLPVAVIDDAAMLLGRLREHTPGSDLDVVATLDATLRSGGKFEPVFSLGQHPQHLTVLVDVEKGSHPFLDAAQWLLSRWQQLGVRFARYNYSFQPNRLTPHPVGAEVDFETLSRRSEGAPLLILARVTQPELRGARRGWLRGLPYWSPCVFLDLDPRPPSERSGEEERILAVLRRAGLIRFPFTAEGLQALVHTLATGSSRPASEASLLPLHQVEPAIRRWAACVACVPDPTWAQLEAFRRHFGELSAALPGPQYLQRLLEWVQRNDRNPIGLHGERLAMSRSFANQLVGELRREDSEAHQDFEARARALILSQLQPATPATEIGRSRQALRIAYHQAILGKGVALLDDFVGTAMEPDMQLLVAQEREAQQAAAISIPGWSRFDEKLSSEVQTVPLSRLLSVPPSLFCRDNILFVAIATCAWLGLLAPEVFGSAGLGLSLLVSAAGLWVAERTVRPARLERVVEVEVSAAESPSPSVSTVDTGDTPSAFREPSLQIAPGSRGTESPANAVDAFNVQSDLEVYFRGLFEEFKQLHTGLQGVGAPTIEYVDFMAPLRAHTAKWRARGIVDVRYLLRVEDAEVVARADIVSHDGEISREADFRITFVRPTQTGAADWAPTQAVGTAVPTAWALDPVREAYYQDLFEEFVKAKLENREPIDTFTYEKFATKLRANTAELTKRDGVTDVLFTVYIKDSKVALKARVIRGTPADRPPVSEDVRPSPPPQAEGVTDVSVATDRSMPKTRPLRSRETVIANLMVDLGQEPSKAPEDGPAQEAYYQEVFEEFVKLKIENEEPIDNFTYAFFAAKLRANTIELMKRPDVKDVQFSVYIKDGKVALKARVVRV